MATLKGFWKLNEVLTDTKMQREAIHFSSNGLFFNSFNFGKKSVDGVYETISCWYSGAIPSEAYFYKEYQSYSTGWVSQEFRLIDFGEFKQNVSDQFYDWFTDNAIEQIEEEHENNFFSSEFPILYSATENYFYHNGLGILGECVSCEVTEEANGIFELSMQYPMDGIHFDEIAERAIIKAKANQYSNPQLFRVYAISKPMNGIVTVLAEHISYDLSGIPVKPFSATTASGALIGLKNNAVVDCPFDFWTDKETQDNFKVSVPVSIRSRLGGVAGSILDVYGGEYEFDNYTVKLHNQRGMNRGVSIRYGKNLTDIKQDQNCSNVATGVYPYWYSETDVGNVLIELPEKIVNAPGTYNFTKIRTVDFSKEFELQPTEEQLRNRTDKYIEDNNIGVPQVSLTVSFAQIEQTQEYKNLKLLDRISLFDTVNVEFPALKVSATAKAVKMVYDVLANRVKSVTLGSIRTNIADTIVGQNSNMNELGKDILAKPSRTELEKAKEAATAWLTDGKGYKVERRDNSGHVIDTLYMDTPNIDEAVNIMRIGQSGIGFSHNGVNGPYLSAWTIDGSFVADWITTGTLNAALVEVINLIAEQLSSVKDDSEVRINGAEFNMFYRNKETVHINNKFGNSAQLEFTVFNENGSLEELGTFNAHQIALGGAGVGNKIYIGVNMENMKPYMILPNDPDRMMNLSWKDNGDGTYSLIGST